MSTVTSVWEATRLKDLVDEGLVTIGSHTYGTPRVHVWRYPDGRASGGTVTIGSFCAISSDVEILTGGEHRPDWISTFPFRYRFRMRDAGLDGHPATKGHVVIGNDVWIGMGAKILSGVTVGNGAVIGAYAIVAGDVRPYSIVVGNPATEIRRRFSDEQIDSLEKAEWWNWSIGTIVKQVPLLSSDRVEEFILSSVSINLNIEGPN